MKKKLKIGLVGANGRMGQEITAILKTKNEFELHLAICRSAALGEFAYTRTTPDCAEAKEVEIWIDFSSPELLAKLISVATKNKTPLVSGTTGLTKADEIALKKAAKIIPILWASNMSLGIAVITEALEVLSRIRQFD
ncbi:MAG: 4-hydroxy-tetrahydrodipicolinate reductase, partial [Pseudobdellovibrionaceae bacterium]